MDDLVKEYLLFRGFNLTLKTFESELRQDKDRSFRADKIVEQLVAYIQAFDLNSLVDYWSYFDHKYFLQLTFTSPDDSNASISHKYELYLYRYYLTNCAQSNRYDKISEFLEKMAPTIQHQSEWKEWFTLPFVKNAEENAIFALYFAPKWRETFEISLQNFYGIIFQNLKYPRLLSYEEDAYWNNSLNQSGSTIKTQVSKPSSELLEDDFLSSGARDDFSLIQSETSAQSNSNSFMTMIKIFGTSKSSHKQSANTSSASNSITSPNSNLSAGKKMKTKTPIQQLVKSFNRNLPSDLVAENERSRSSSFLTQSPSISSNNDQLNASVANDEPEKSPKTTKMLQDNYEMLSHEFFKEHKSTIVHCKCSKDGQFVASVDVNGIVKVWDVNESLSVVSTLIQKSPILSMEWDAKNHNILYLGSEAAVVRVYDAQEKKFIQALEVNKAYPRVTQICSFIANQKLLIATASQRLKIRDIFTRNGQLLLCNIGSEIFVEKTIDLIEYFTHTITSCLNNYALIGCSDGFIRVFHFETCEIVSNRKCHDGNITALQIDKKQKSLYSVSSDGTIKKWLFDGNFMHSPLEIKPLSSLKVPTEHQPLGVYQMTDKDINTKFTCMGSLSLMDANDNIFIAARNGVFVYALERDSLKLIALFDASNVTSIDIYSGGDGSCTLYASSLDATVHAFKILTHF